MRTLYGSLIFLVTFSFVSTLSVCAMDGDLGEPSDGAGPKVQFLEEMPRDPGDFEAQLAGTEVLLSPGYQLAADVKERLLSTEAGGSLESLALNEQAISDEDILKMCGNTSFYKIKRLFLNETHITAKAIFDVFFSGIYHFNMKFRPVGLGASASGNVPLSDNQGFRCRSEIAVYAYGTSVTPNALTTYREGLPEPERDRVTISILDDVVFLTNSEFVSVEEHDSANYSTYSRQLECHCGQG